MKLLPVLSGLLIMSSSTHGADTHSAFTLRGVCHTFFIGAEDLTGICSGEVVQAVYTDSSMDLAIWTTENIGRFIVLRGMADEKDGNLELTINQIIDGKDGSGDDNVETKAAGRCVLFGNPMTGHADYTCRATDEAGVTYKFDFRTDGSMPENLLD